MTDEHEEEQEEPVELIPAHRLILQLVPKVTGYDLEQEMSEHVDVTHLVQPEIWYGRVQISKPLLGLLQEGPSRTRLIGVLQNEAEFMVDELLEALSKDRHKLVMYVRNGFLSYLAMLPPQQ